MKLRNSLYLALAVATFAATAAAAADLEGLRPSARWLATERLKGTLFHHTNIEPMEKLLVSPLGGQSPATPAEKGTGPICAKHPPGRSGKSDLSPFAGTLTLRGRHYLVVLPTAGQPMRLRLKTLQVRPPFTQTLYAVFNADGVEIAQGLVEAKAQREVVVKTQDSRPHLVLLNSGPASSTATEVAVLGGPWSVDVRPRQPFRDGPMRYAFLRDLKLGGFNVAMIDVESAPQEFLSDAGLAKWTELVRPWTDAARRYQLRAILAVDLGGTRAEVESWGDAPKGLYVKHFDKHPLAPCPLQKIYWERILLRRGREVAKLARENPYVVGYGIDPEMYQCWDYGHYMLGGTCFCDHCLGGFLRREGLPADVLRQQPTGEARHRWLVDQKQWRKYEAYLEEEMSRIAAWCRDELHRIDPDLLWCVYVLDIDNWFCRGLARGLSRPDLPVINFCEATYYSLGYDKPWLEATTQRLKRLGSNFLQASALWDLHFPPTRPGLLAGHAYNLAVRCEGWWYWPGDRLYDDWNVTQSYQGRPAYVEDYWNAAAWANHEIALSMREPGRASPLDTAQRPPWRGKFLGDEKGWSEDSGVKPCHEPLCRLRLAAPATVYFQPRRGAKEVAVTCLARGPRNGASLRLLDPTGTAMAIAEGEFNAPAKIAAPAREGVWAVEVKPLPGLDLTDVGLAFDSAKLVAPSRECLLVSPTKKPGLVAYWPMDDGQGDRVSDVSQKVAYDGVLRGGTWTTGVRGGAVRLADLKDGILVPAGDSLHQMTDFTLSAWVRLDAFPQQGNGATLVNKGPEAPGQHFWWWIGYPPDYPLVLELGSEKHQYGKSFNTGRLAWELGRWYHVAVTCTSRGGKTTVCHYRDGQQQSSRTSDDDFHSGPHDVQLGSYGAMHTLRGALDEVKIWDRVLSASEIRREAERPSR